MSEMDNPRKISKELTFSDYIEHPIWGFWDDDGDDVTFADNFDSFNSPGGEALWARCKFEFRDGTKSLGVIGIRTTNWSAYLLKFVNPDNSLFYFPINSMLEGSVTPNQLAKQLNKSANDIFPDKI
jgi:hypothetical protein